MIAVAAGCVAVVRSLPHLPNEWVAASLVIVAIAVVFAGAFALAALLRDVVARAVPPRVWRALIGLGVSAWAGAVVWMALFSVVPVVVGAPVLGASGPWPPTTAMIVALVAAATMFVATGLTWARASAQVRRVIHIAVVVSAYVVVTELIVTSARQLSLPFALCCWGWVALAVCASPPGPLRPRWWHRLAPLLAVALLSFAFPALPSASQTVLTGRLPVVDALLLPRTTAVEVATDECVELRTTSHAADLGPKQHGLVLVVIDTLRTDRVTPELMPNLSGWSEGASLRFDRAYAPAPSTDQSLNAMFALRESPNLFEELAQHDVLVRAVSSHPGVTAILQRAGIEHVDERSYQGQDFRFALTSHTVSDVALEQLAALRAQPEPFVLVVHYYDPHEYYVPNELFDFGPGRANRYDAEVAYTDVHLGRLLDATRDDAHDEVAVMVTTDHGEELWDHGYVSHSYALYDESTRVFIAADVPDASPSTFSFPVLNTVVRDATRAILLGEPFSVLEEPVHLAMREKRATVVGHRKWIWHGDHGVAELYDLKADPGEQNNLFNAAKLDALSHCVAAFNP